MDIRVLKMRRGHQRFENVGADLRVRPLARIQFKIGAHTQVRPYNNLNQGETQMPTYITLLNWTQQGIGKVKGSPKRLDAGRKAFKKLGVDLKDVYLTMGRYDLVCVLEAPDSESVAKALLSLAADGNVSSETLAAFTEDEYRKIVGSL